MEFTVEEGFVLGSVHNELQITTGTVRNGTEQSEAREERNRDTNTM